LINEQKGYIMTVVMTSDPLEQKARARARLAELLSRPPDAVEDATVAANRLIWNRATEQERRRMLKDCGWL
jgi:hypothetical protein